MFCNCFKSSVYCITLIITRGITICSRIKRCVHKVLFKTKRNIIKLSITIDCIFHAVFNFYYLFCIYSTPAGHKFVSCWKFRKWKLSFKTSCKVMLKKTVTIRSINKWNIHHNSIRDCLLHSIRRRFIVIFCFYNC